MSYELLFDRRALKEWRKLDDTLRRQFREKLKKVLIQPRIEANRLRGLPDCYKIKLRQSGYRLIYQLREKEVVVFVVAIGKRNRDEAYRKTGDRLQGTP